MDILQHSAEGAVIHLDQRELLMVMALIQEGRDSFECSGQTGQALDQLFCSANILVEEARRQDIQGNLLRHKLGKVGPAENDPDYKKEGANG